MEKITSFHSKKCFFELSCLKVVKMKWYQWFFSKFEPTQFLLRKPKKVILRAFLSKNGKNDIVEVIFLQNWAYTIFFVTKFQYWEKKLVRPLVANDENKIFCLRSTQKCSQVSKKLSYFCGICKKSLTFSNQQWRKWNAYQHIGVSLEGKSKSIM